MSIPFIFLRRLCHHFGTGTWLSAVAIFILGLAGSAHADMLSVDKSVWQMKYGVTDTQINDSAWLAADTDGDGIKNIDELAAGTNPFNASKTISVSSISKSGANAVLQFPTEDGKRYRAESTATLGNSGSWVLQPVGSPTVVMGDGTTKSITIPYVANSYYRIRVDDVSTSGDTVSDWAKKILGYNVNTNMTDGRTLDANAIPAALASLNQVTVTVTKPNATQPPDALTAPVDVGTITVSRGLSRLGALTAPSITVNLQKVGTAVEGTLPTGGDYDGIPSTILFNSLNATQSVLTINPRFSATRKTNVTAIVKAMPGTGYTLGSASSGSVVINPTGNANGTGLTGNYFNTSSSTYSPTQTNIFAGGVATGTMSRTDATIDFANGVNGWGSTAGPTGLSSPSTNGAFSVRWTGQILPQYSEKYFIDFRSDDSAKVWVNGVLLIDRWVGQGVTDYSNSINLTAGVLYDIQIDYWNSSGTAEAHLYWWSPSQTRQIVPQTRLFPAPSLSAKPTTLTNSLTAIGYQGVPFSFSVVSPNISGTVTYALDANSGPLPTGLTLAASTGLITGTPTVAGSSNVSINATNTAAGGPTGSSVINFTILPTGAVTREVLGTAPGSKVSDITLPNGTVTHDTIPTLDEDTDYGNNTGERLRGYIVPPKTGNYYFWIAANNAAELWISNDAEYVNKVRRATVTASTGKKVWNSSATQQSAWLSLVAGQKYYFEVLHNTGADADDYVEVGWCQDDIGTVPSVASAPNPNGTPTLIPNGGAALSGYPLSGTVPGYIFQPYDYPTATVVSGALYACNLGPQGVANTKASGSATLQTNAAGNAATSAILHFNYGNLSSPRTGYHLHSDGFATHSAGEIIFDIDDIDANHPELKTADGGYIWNFTTVGDFTSIQQIRDAITGGYVYLNIHTVINPNGEIRGNLTFVNGSQTPPNPTLYTGVNAPAATDSPSNTTHAARFLNQATFGASPADISSVGSLGFDGWITDQINNKPTSHSSNDVVNNITADINQPYPSANFTNAWWKYSISGPDQLRQRVAFAMSEIMVVSWANDTGPLASNGRVLADYYDNLLDYSLPSSGFANSGNFRGILKAISLTPAMGLYLNMQGNQKGDDTVGRHPNENYGREIMQLFSVGLNRRWDDGNFVLTSAGNSVPTYSQPSISGVSALLTGWNYAQALQSNGRLPTSFGPGANYLDGMVLVPAFHETNSKLLLNNVVTPAATGQTPRVSISSITTGTPNCTVNTSTIHGLKAGDTIRIDGIATGTFTGGYPAINTTLQVASVTSATAFAVPVACTANTTTAAGTVTGSTVILSALNNATGAVTAVTGSQFDNSNFTGWTLPHPYDNYGTKELDAVIDNIVNNDNVPPYICRQLIQRLVTSDPSPGYLYRVVQKFKDNGSGVRGDMVAVLRQILLDGEARSSDTAAANPSFGKQREPLLRLTGPARAFPAAPYAGTYAQLTGINSNRLRITTSAPNDYSASSQLSLNFEGNYTTTAPPNPLSNPTTGTYTVAGTAAIASTYTDIASITPGGNLLTTIVTVQPHGLATGNTVTLTGVSGNTSPSITTAGISATVINANTFTIPVTATRAFQVTNVAVGSPCVVTAPGHGLPPGTTSVVLSGINGGTFSSSVNTTVNATYVDANNFTLATTGNVAISCTLAPSSITTFREVSNPCRVTTVAPHGLTTGASITIASVSGGTFTPTINFTYPVTVIDASSFTIPINCTAASTNNTGNIIGGNTLDVTVPEMINVAYSQLAMSSTMTISTAGPATDVAIPSPNSGTTTLKSKVYLSPVTVASTVGIASIAVGNPCTISTSQNHGLTSGNSVTIASVSGGTFAPAINNLYTVTVTGATTFTVPSNCTVAPTAGTGNITGNWISAPTSGIYAVVTSPGTTFTVDTTPDIPAGPRSGNVIIPKVGSSYTPISSNNFVQFNVNSNHFMTTNDHVWVDAPVVVSPLTDGEYIVTAPITGSGILPVDEDHFQTSYLPVSSGLGTYPHPSGSNNGATLWPLIPPPGVTPLVGTGSAARSGNLVINQSTYGLGSTEGTLSQSPLNAPTVFNYFLPSYRFPGALSGNNLDSPEFQLTTATNISNLTNSLTNMWVGTGGGNSNPNGPSSFNNGNGTVVVDIGSTTFVNYLTLAQTQDSGINTLIDTLANLLCGGPLQAGTKTTIFNFVTYKRTITNISQQSPCVVTTSSAHGLTTGNQIAINDVTGGTFTGGSSGINGSWIVTVTGANTFTLGTVVASPVAENCTSNTTISYTNANISNFPMNIPSPGPSNLQMRDRVRAIIHLILTSAEYAVQK